MYIYCKKISEQQYNKSRPWLFQVNYNSYPNKVKIFFDEISAYKNACNAMIDKIKIHKKWSQEALAAYHSASPKRNKIYKDKLIANYIKLTQRKRIIMTKPIQNLQSNIQDINDYKVKIQKRILMQSKTHLFFALSVATIPFFIEPSWIISLALIPYFLGGISLGALFPDIDKANSSIGRKLLPYHIYIK